MLQAVFAGLAICCGVGSLIAVCIWATDTTAGLGAPEWGMVDAFPAYHPVLMVAGFHFAQVLGICMWSSVTDHNVAKTLHVIFMLGGVATMGAGLSSVVSYETYLTLPAITSMHAVIGVFSIVIYCLQVIGGFYLGMLSATGTLTPTLKTIVMMHRATGLISLILTTIATVSGIQNYLPGPRGYEVTTSYPSYGGGYGNYGNYGSYSTKYVSKGSCGTMTDGCQAGFAVGLLVTLSAMFTGLSVYARALAIQEKAAAIAPNEDKQVPSSNNPRVHYVVPVAEPQVYPQSNNPRDNNYEMVQQR
jgi:hypothetical protein